LRLGLRISGLPCNYWRRDGRASDMSLKVFHCNSNFHIVIDICLNIEAFD
jgi:hypothetical protein